MEWFGFWIFLAVVVAADAWLYSKWHSCFIYCHKSDAEIRLLEAIVVKAEKEAGIYQEQPMEDGE